MSITNYLKEQSRRYRLAGKMKKQQSAKARANRLIQFKEYGGRLYIAVDGVPLIPSDLIKSYTYKADESEMCEALKTIRTTVAAYFNTHNVNIEL